MQSFLQEVDQNFDSFFNEVEANISSVIADNNAYKDKFKESYRRLVSYQAWKSEILEKIACDESLQFFTEAQNDGLMSHALARQGSWRVALMSLRSCIENTVFGLYYLEHPVELKLWAKNKHKLGFTETITYLAKHPSFIDINEPSILGIEALKNEYATLSKAVHGSSKLFRMTKTGSIEGLNITSMPDFGGWQSRERAVLNALNLLLTTFFKEDLVGSANANLRKAVSIAVSSDKFVKIKEHYRINLNK
ncbi:hypothetical protein [Enterovibrio baiacu]|uniref:hypothetical protein n=1 Tax=Enterovibrio baiacu TaxID=2491023 RepID=UPI003D0FB0C4